MSWKKLLKNINLTPTEQKVEEAKKRGVPLGNPAIVQAQIKLEKKQQIEEQIRNLQEEFNKKKAELESRKRDLESSQMFHN